MTSHGLEIKGIIYASTDDVGNSITKKLDAENELQCNCHNYFIHNCIFLQGNTQISCCFQNTVLPLGIEPYLCVISWRTAPCVSDECTVRLK